MAFYSDFAKLVVGEDANNGKKKIAEGSTQKPLQNKFGVASLQISSKKHD
jgi:hypothetical protein